MKLSHLFDGPPLSSLYLYFMLKMTPFKFLMLKENETEFMFVRESCKLKVQAAYQGKGRLETLGLFVVVLVLVLVLLK